MTLTTSSIARWCGAAAAILLLGCSSNNAVSNTVVLVAVKGKVSKAKDLVMAAISQISFSRCLAVVAADAVAPANYWTVSG